MANQKNEFAGKLGFIYAILIIAAFLILGQVLYIQVAKGDEYRALSDERNIDTLPVTAVRGNIFDVNGNVLATSVPIFDIRMDVACPNISDKLFNQKVDSIAIGLVKIFGLKSKKDYKRLLVEGRKKNKHGVLLHKGATFTELKEVKKLPILRLGRFKGGLLLEQHYLRVMPYGMLARRTIGYENEEKKLYVGLEGAFNEELKGTSDTVLMQRITTGGEWIPIMNSEHQEPRNGHDIVTTIDKNLQDVAEMALMHHLQEQGAYQGCAILMEVATGEIRAIANLRKNKAGQYDEIYNYSIAESIEPGSTFKLASLLAILEEGSVDLNDMVKYSGSVVFANRTMKDSHTLPISHITLKQTLEQSSNVGTSLFANRVFGKNPQKFIDRLYAMNLNQPLGVEMAGENPPFIKDTKHRSWWKTSLPWMSIGYELKVTPLQTLTLYNAVANNGVMVKPMFVKAIKDKNTTVKTFSPTVINKAICSPSTIAKAKTVLESIVTDGTAKEPFKETPYKVAGKTGTALIAKNGSYKDKIYNASFVGYFPADNPKYSCIVVVNNPSHGKIYGGAVAAPVFREIADRVFATNVTVNDTSNLYARALPIPDTGAILLPPITSGNSADLLQVTNLLGVPVTISGTAAEWTACKQEEGHLVLCPKKLGKESLPDVIGMTPRDAVYILELYGLKVKLVGKGRVSSQSLPAGSKAQKGSQITLTLTNA